MAPVRPNPTLSDDLISEILVRVPVKSLLCFQLVCKAWLSLIKHPAFVKSQLIRAITSQTHQTLLMRYRKHSPSVINTSLLDVDSRQIVSDLKLPSRGEPVPWCIVVGSANGIVCVIVVIVAASLEARLYLWNPATRQSKLIPRSDALEFGYDAVKQDVLGFGYDPIDHEYKVVSTGLLKFNSVEMYLANRDEWRKGPDLIDFPLNEYFDVCVDGFLCGIGGDGMMVFDLHKEVLNCGFKRPAINRDVHDDDDDETRIIEFNKSIAVIVLWNSGLNDNKKINMWTLDDDACLRGGGVEASWTSMFSIDLAMPAHLILGYFNNRDLLVLTGEMWISCNADKKEFKIIPLSVEMAGHHYTKPVYKYTESLVSLPGFQQINWNAGFQQINWNAGEDDNLLNTADF